MALTLARFSDAPDTGPTRRYYQHINKFSAQFAFATDMAMLTLGGYLKQKEHLSARLGDVLSSLYMASMVLKHYENQGRPEADLPLVEWSLRTLLYKAQEQLHGFLRNFPNRWMAALMRFVIFPRGRTYFAPSDRLGRQIVEPLMMPSGGARASGRRASTRRSSPGNPLGLLQEALVLAVSRRAAREAHPRRGRQDGAHHRARPAGPDRAGAGERAPERERGRSCCATTIARSWTIINVDDFDPSELAAAEQAGQATGNWRQIA